MGAFLTLVATCAVMFCAAMFAGDVPIRHATLLPTTTSSAGSPSSFLSSVAADSRASSLDVVSAVGAGLLISTALAVVVPEGFHLLTAIEKKAAVAEASSEARDYSNHGDHDHDLHHHHAGAVPHWLPGFSLAAGFFFMMTLDALSASPHSHGSCGSGAHGTTSSSPSNAAESGAATTTATTTTAAPPTAPTTTSSAAASGALRALVVHAAADGLAVGASCAASASARGAGASTLAWSVAAAMALHKAPAAFGLSATLASAQWGSRRARRGLLFFSLSSPVAAFATFFALLIFGGNSGSETGLGVAAALLFSGGTLVHAAAVHVLPSVAPRLAQSFGSGGGDGGGATAASEVASRVRYALAAGAAAPLLLSALAPHEH